MRRSERQARAIVQELKRRIRKKNEPNGIIIYDPEKDPNGEKAKQEFYRKYPDYANDGDGVVIYLPEIEKLPDK